MKAGFGGVAIHTVETYDLAQYLSERQSQLEAAVVRLRPGDCLSTVCETVQLGKVQKLFDLVSDPLAWKRELVSQLQFALQPFRDSPPENPEHLAGLLNVIPAHELNSDELQDVRVLVILQNVLGEDVRKNMAVIEYLQRGTFVGSKTSVMFAVTTHEKQLGPQLAPYLPVLEYASPDLIESSRLIGDVVKQKEPDFSDEDLATLAQACRGMTRRQIENTAALLLRRDDYRDPEQYKQVKIEQAHNDGLFRVLPTDTGNELFGLEGLTDFAAPLLKPLVPGTSSDLRPKGLIFVGPPGSGKTAAATQLARLSQRTLCHVDLGTLRTKWVGETEARVSRMLELVESLSPSVLLLDEIEKSLDGAQSSGETDGGLGSRVLAKFLTWAQDHEEDVVLVATANDITKITDNFPEMLRAERFDAMFMFDLPCTTAREEIWRHYMKRFGVKGSARELAITSDNWTGAEIRACCRISAMRGVPVSEQMSLVPIVYNVASPVVTAVREYASGKFIDAATGKIYSSNKGKKSAPNKTKTRRRVDSSEN